VVVVVVVVVVAVVVIAAAAVKVNDSAKLYFVIQYDTYLC